MRILIIEDQEHAATYLQKGLRENGFHVDIASNGVDGLHLALTEQYGLIVLDIMLPGIDGWSVLELIRKQKPTLPVLCLTARDGVEDRVRGLELGADDYLVKPFAFSELLARIRVIFRRIQGVVAQRETLLTIADLELDLLSRKATRRGQRIDLTPKEFALMALLLRRQGEALSRTQIAEQVWDMNFDSDTNVIDVAVRRLRAKVDADFTPKLIHNVRGVGYILEVRDE
ncbi:DNA-binding response regulator [Burkholderia sp. SRS-W-2-2016]|uniref:heavy metal response regulator transcription factor n=1 Tax=Burkholderia sp. SRS-W-2-2016 TaxID=1926878 RepID=UPI00094B09A8|nr:heavy metal response regulator transcription factor [Burkholderia sp. SRS-W-2-2016]OLL27251.1 DNA-binding response regulator [Burkholderia sp. SRS-W-2-2016]